MVYTVRPCVSVPCGVQASNRHVGSVEGLLPLPTPSPFGCLASLTSFTSLPFLNSSPSLALLSSLSIISVSLSHFPPSLSLRSVCPFLSCSCAERGSSLPFSLLVLKVNSCLVVYVAARSTYTPLVAVTLFILFAPLQSNLRLTHAPITFRHPKYLTTHYTEQHM